MRELKDFVTLPYKKELQFDVDDRVFVARVAELPGCTAHGETEIEALAMLAEVFANWITSALEQGVEVPLPQQPEKLPSGKFVVRCGGLLHRALNHIAERQGVSLNQVAANAFSEYVSVYRAKSVTREAIEVVAHSSRWAETEPSHWSMSSRANVRRYLREGRRSVQKRAVWPENVAHIHRRPKERA